MIWNYSEIVTFSKVFTWLPKPAVADHQLYSTTWIFISLLAWEIWPQFNTKRRKEGRVCCRIRGNSDSNFYLMNSWAEGGVFISEYFLLRNNIKQTQARLALHHFDMTSIFQAHLAYWKAMSRICIAENVNKTSRKHLFCLKETSDEATLFYSWTGKPN